MNHGRHNAGRRASIRILFVYAFVFIATYTALGQTPELSVEQDVESYVTDNDKIGAALEDLQDFGHNRKIDPNRLNIPDMLKFMSMEELTAVRLHIMKYGPLGTVWELQAIKGISVQKARELAPYFRFDKRQTFREESTEFLLLTTIKGGLQNIPAYSIRLRGQTDNGFNYHVTCDQDAGEPYTFNNRQAGYDFVSAGIEFSPPQFQSLKFIIGDFRAVFAQGLTLGQGFGIQKSVDLNLMVLGGDRTGLHRSTSESGFMRGFLVNFKGKALSCSLIGSRRNEKATLHIDEQGNQYFRAFYTGNSGSGSADRGTVDLKEAALRIHARLLKSEIGVTQYFRITDIPMYSIDPYKQLTVHPGSIYFRNGLDWSTVIGTFYFFGEATVARGNKTSIVTGILKSLSKQLDISVILRNYDLDPVTYNKFGISEGSTASNERGTLFALSYSIDKGNRIQWLTDLYHKPLAQGITPGPVYGFEHIIKLSGSWQRGSSVYLQLSSKERTGYFARSGDPVKFARQQKKYYYRVQLEHEINEFLRLRMRVMGAIDPGVDGQWSGLGYADMRYKPDHTKSSFTFRWNFFLIPDYSLRLYVYENDVLYSHSIPAFGKSGTRVYAIWTYRLSKRFRIQMKSGISLFQEGIKPNESSAYPLKGVPDVRILIRWKK